MPDANTDTDTNPAAVAARRLVAAERWLALCCRLSLGAVRAASSLSSAQALDNPSAQLRRAFPTELRVVRVQLDGDVMSFVTNNVFVVRRPNESSVCAPSHLVGLLQRCIGTVSRPARSELLSTTNQRKETAMAAKTRTIIKTKYKTKEALVSTGMSDEQLRRAALTG
jgi:hypothetical protein